MKAKDNRPTEFILPSQISQKDIEGYTEKYHFTEIAPLGFGQTYKAKWDIWSSIREFVQNAFDITAEGHGDREALSKILLEYDSSNNIGYIIDHERGIKYENMFLAETKEQTAVGIDCMRGKFGEGMKFALIPLIRDGHSVIIRTVGFDYHFCSVKMKQGSFNLIHLFQLPNRVTEGTCIAIQEVDPTIYRDRFIPLRLIDKPKDLLLEAKLGCKVRQVLTRTGSRGRFYIRDIFICEIDSLYDYNFWFKDPTRVLDPDRSSIRLETRLEAFLQEFIKLFKADGGWLAPTSQTEHKKEDPSMRLRRLRAARRENVRRGEQSEVDPRIQVWEPRKVPPTSFWSQFFKGILSDKHPKRLFEFTILDFSSENECTVGMHYSLAKDVFGCLAGVLETSSFGWSQDYFGGKDMEHHRVIDLQNKLPDLSSWLADFVLTPAKIKALRRQQATDQIVIVPDDFEPLGSSAVAGVKQLYKQLAILADGICAQFNSVTPPIYLYTGTFQDERIGASGHTNYEIISLNWNIIGKALREFMPRFVPKKSKRKLPQRRKLPRYALRRIVEGVTTELTKVLLHELTHYCCNQIDSHQECGDLTESFENTMEDVMMAFARLTGELVLEEGTWLAPVASDRFGGDALDDNLNIEENIKTLLLAMSDNYSDFLQIETLWNNATDKAQRMEKVDALLTEERKAPEYDIKRNRRRLVQRALRAFGKKP